MKRMYPELDMEEFIQVYGNIIAAVSEEELRAYFNDDTSTDAHIEDCFLLWSAGMSYGMECMI